MTCPAGKFAIGGRCYTHCPAGYSNTLTSCFRPAADLGLGSMTCPAGKYPVGGRCYIPCSAGYKNTLTTCFRGADLKTQSAMTCPADFLQINTIIGGRCYKANSVKTNGASPKPFWIYSDNPTSKAQVNEALANGANALKTSVLIRENAKIDKNGTLIPADIRVIYTFGATPTDPMPLYQYLDMVHESAAKYPKLALLVLDIQSPYEVNPALGRNGIDIVKLVHRHLLRLGQKDAINLEVIYSARTVVDAKMFQHMVPYLTANEGIEVNQQGILNYNEGKEVNKTDSSTDMVNAFKTDSPLVTENYAFSSGAVIETMIDSDALEAIEGSAFNRAKSGLPKTSSAFKVVDLATMQSFITTGADAIVTNNVPMLSKLVAARTDIRLATREDSPFKPLNEAYALKVYTADTTEAGTDAKLTFTLTGCKGSATATINAARRGRMEKGATNYVTLPSKDLGNLIRLTVSRNNGGLYPDWDLDKVDISSLKWRANAGVATAVFSRFIPTLGTSADLLDGGCS